MDDHSLTGMEIRSQFVAWEEALRAASTALPSAHDFEQVVFTGCGSTYYLSLAASALYQELTGRTARALPAGELLLNPQTALPPSGVPQLLVAVSRSGTTTETVRAVEEFKAARRGQVIAISNNESPLSGLADLAILITKGAEESVAQTRSFASMYVAAAAMCSRMAGRAELTEAMASLPESGRKLLTACEPIVERMGTNHELANFYFLGSGIRYGLACEAHLKMTEMALTTGGAFHFLEFRHGPMSLVGPATVVIGLLSDENRRHELAVIDDMQALRAVTLTLAESGADIVFNSGIPESVRGVLYLPALQLLALRRSLAKGLNPDRPQNLTAVVHLNL